MVTTIRHLRRQRNRVFLNDKLKYVVRRQQLSDKARTHHHQPIGQREGGVARQLHRKQHFYCRINHIAHYRWYWHRAARQRKHRISVRDPSQFDKELDLSPQHQDSPGRQDRHRCHYNWCGGHHDNKGPEDSVQQFRCCG